MDRSKVKIWAPVVAGDVKGLEKFDAETLLHGVGFAEGEIWEIISGHDTGDGFVSGTYEEISKTIISVIGTSSRVSMTKKIFDKHCICKRLDANGKCDAFCFHNRLKSSGVMVDCIGIESRPVAKSGHIVGSTRL